MFMVTRIMAVKMIAATALTVTTTQVTMVMRFGRTAGVVGIHFDHDSNHYHGHDHGCQEGQPLDADDWSKITVNISGTVQHTARSSNV